MSAVKRWIDDLQDAAVAGDEEARETLLDAGLADEITAAEWEGREPLLPLEEMAEAERAEGWWALCFLNEPPAMEFC